jgi:hypothetical protein
MAMVSMLFVRHCEGARIVLDGMVYLIRIHSL